MQISLAFLHCYVAHVTQQNSLISMGVYRYQYTEVFSHILSLFWDSLWPILRLGTVFVLLRQRLGERTARKNTQPISNKQYKHCTHIHLILNYMWVRICHLLVGVCSILWLHHPSRVNSPRRLLHTGYDLSSMHPKIPTAQIHCKFILSLRKGILGVRKTC